MVFRRRKEQERKEQERFEMEQRAKGLIEFKGKWGTPQQVEEWKEKDRMRMEQLKSTKKFVRSWATPSMQQIKVAKEEIRLVDCQYCKAKFDLLKTSTCPYCGAPFRELFSTERAKGGEKF